MDERETQLKAFVLERTKPDQKEAMGTMIDEVIEKHRQGKMNTMYLMGVVPKAMGMIQPEAMGEIKAKMDELR